MGGAGRPEAPPQAWQVEGGPQEGQTDPAEGVEAHSQNLQTQGGRARAAGAASRPSRAPQPVPEVPAAVLGCRGGGSWGTVSSSNSSPPRPQCHCSYGKGDPQHPVRCMYGGGWQPEALHTMGHSEGALFPASARLQA